MLIDKLIYQEPTDVKITSTHSESPFQKPSFGLRQARMMFEQLGIPFTQAGLVSSQLSRPQVDLLVDWSRKNEVDGHQMTSAEAFYGKTLLALSMWPQRHDGRIAWLAGKGWGAELALQGHVQGRVKAEDLQIPLRSHSDFEFYNVRDFEESDSKWGQGHPPLPPYIKEVLWLIEAFPPTHTKLLRNLPNSLFDQTAEVVDLEGYKILIPNLELLFVDKLISPESKSKQRALGADHEILARVYRLDKRQIHHYLEDYYVKYWVGQVSPNDKNIYEAKHAEIDKIIAS